MLINKNIKTIGNAHFYAVFSSLIWVSIRLVCLHLASPGKKYWSFEEEEEDYTATALWLNHNDEFKARPKSILGIFTKGIRRQLCMRQYFVHPLHFVTSLEDSYVEEIIIFGLLSSRKGEQYEKY